MPSALVKTLESVIVESEESGSTLLPAARAKGETKTLNLSFAQSHYESVIQEYRRVLAHAVSLGIEADQFLRCWREGDWDGCREFSFNPNEKENPAYAPFDAEVEIEVKPRFNEEEVMAIETAIELLSRVGDGFVDLAAMTVLQDMIPPSCETLRSEAAPDQEESLSRSLP